MSHAQAAVGHSQQVVVEEEQVVGHHVALLGPVAFVEQVVGESCLEDALLATSGIDVVAVDECRHHLAPQVVCVAEFPFPYMKFQNAEVGGDIGVCPHHPHFIDGLVVGGRLVVESRHVDYVAIVVKKVDILVLVGDDEPMCRLAIGDVRDVAVAEHIGVVVGLYAVVGDTVGEESARTEHIDGVARGHNLCDVAVGQVGGPGADGCCACYE